MATREDFESKNVAARGAGRMPNLQNLSRVPWVLAEEWTVKIFHPARGGGKDPAPILPFRRGANRAVRRASGHRGACPARIPADAAAGHDSVSSGISRSRPGRRHVRLFLKEWKTTPHSSAGIVHLMREPQLGCSVKRKPGLIDCAASVQSDFLKGLAKSLRIPMSSP